MIQAELDDPCDPPNSITSPGLTAQSYTLTKQGQGYNAPAFTADPAYCPLEYRVSETKFTNSQGNTQSTAISSPSANSREFSFFWDQDDSPLTQTQVVTITAVSKSDYGTTETIEAEDSFTLSFVSPCNDATMVTIQTTSQTNPNSDAYSNQPVVFTYNPFLIEPSFCRATIKCVTPPSNPNLPCIELVNN